MSKESGSLRREDKGDDEHTRAATQETEMGNRTCAGGGTRRRTSCKRGYLRPRVLGAITRSLALLSCPAP